MYSLRNIIIFLMYAFTYNRINYYEPVYDASEWCGALYSPPELTYIHIKHNSTGTDCTYICISTVQYVNCYAHRRLY